MALLFVDLILKPAEDLAMLFFKDVVFSKPYLTGVLFYGLSNYARLKDDPSVESPIVYSLLMAPIAPIVYLLWPYSERVYFYADKYLLKGWLPCGAP